MSPISPKEYLAYLRNFIFGVEDSLVSTVGLLSGIAAADVSRGTIVLTGIVLIFVEAFSMGVGSYLSEYSIENFRNRKLSERTPVVGGAIMLASYLIAGMVPLFPYLVAERGVAFWWSIGCSMVGLVVLGLVSGRMARSKALQNMLRMLLLGGLAIGIGVVVGRLVGQ